MLLTTVLLALFHRDHGLVSALVFFLFSVVSFVVFFFLAAGRRYATCDTPFRARRMSVNVLLSYVFAAVTANSLEDILAGLGHTPDVVAALNGPLNWLRFGAYCVACILILAVSVFELCEEWRNKAPERNYRLILFRLFLLQIFMLSGVNGVLFASAGTDTIMELGGGDALYVATADCSFFYYVLGPTSLLLLLFSLRVIRDDMAGVKPLVQWPFFRTV